MNPRDRKLLREAICVTSMSAMNTMNTARIACILFLLAATACDDAEPEKLGSRAGRFWDNIVCVRGTCYGHRPMAIELWSPLVADCELDNRVENNGWVETDLGYTEPCDVGGMPEGFVDVRCFAVGNAIRCFGGDEGWYTEAGPACDTDSYTSSVWMQSSCDPNKQMGNYAYEYVFASPMTSDARVFNGSTHFQVVPECRVAGGVLPPDPFAC
jgi:hypothetical protein